MIEERHLLRHIMFDRTIIGLSETRTELVGQEHYEGNVEEY